MFGIFFSFGGLSTWSTSGASGPLCEPEVLTSVFISAREPDCSVEPGALSSSAMRKGTDDEHDDGQVGIAEVRSSKVRTS